MKTAVAVVLMFVLVGQSLWAGVPDQKHEAKIRKRVSQYLEDGRRVSVETYDDRKLAGVISQAAPDDFVLINAGRLVTLRYGEVRKIKAPMDPQKRSIIATMAVLGGLFGTLLYVAAHDQ